MNMHRKFLLDLLQDDGGGLCCAAAYIIEGISFARKNDSYISMKTILIYFCVIVV